MQRWVWKRLSETQQRGLQHPAAAQRAEFVLGGAGGETLSAMAPPWEERTTAQWRRHKLEEEVKAQPCSVTEGPPWEHVMVQNPPGDRLPAAPFPKGHFNKASPD